MIGQASQGLAVWSGGRAPAAAGRDPAVSARTRALRQVDHFVKRAADDLQRMGAAPAALHDLLALGERLRLEIYER